MLIPLLCSAAPLPQEGKLDFDLCFAGTVQHTEVGPQHAVGSFESLGSIYSRVAAGPFDRQGVRCLGTYQLVEGKHLGVGYCIHVDLDGDKWIERWEAGPDFSGTWTAIGGSGKYAGMQASGNFKPNGPVASALANSVQQCNHNTGSYRLR
jgi:hypothetical protein